MITDKISVIVPIYNADKFLEKCIISIINQDYKNLEIILVNDGSTDKSAIICESYRKKDTRIKVIHKKNEGLVSARKSGINRALGKFVCWVDADDWVERHFIQGFVETLNEYGTDADVVAMALWHDIGASARREKNGFENGSYTLAQILPKLIYTGDFFEYGICPHLVTKMFKRSIIADAINKVDNIIIAGEDAASVYPAILNCKKIIINNEANYHYVQHTLSITKRTTVNEQERIEKLFDYLIEEFEQKKVYDIMKKQTKVYRNYMFAMRQISVFDKQGEILSPFGGIERNSKIVLYGAGVMGQMLYAYITLLGSVTIQSWVDGNYLYYSSIGREVVSPDILKSWREYDLVLVATVSKAIFMEIENRLKGYGIPERKIRWFTSDFQCE